MTGYMAAHIDGDRQACDMGWIGLNADCQRRYRAAKSLRADPCSIDACKQVRFQLRIKVRRVGLANRPKQRFFRKKSALFEITADTYADNDRRTGIAACTRNRIDDKIHNLIASGRGRKHLYCAHIFTAKALGRYCNMQPVSRHNLRVDDCGRVIPRIFAYKRIPDDRQAQVPLCITAAVRPRLRLHTAAAHDMYVLPKLQKHNRHSRVLADWAAFALC